MEVNNRFVEEYAKEYFCDGERAKVVQEKKCRLLRSSRYPEKEIERILSEGIKNAEDVVHILAWKTGKISHKECTEETPFSYCGSWKDLGECENWADVPEHRYALGIPASHKGYCPRRFGSKKLGKMGKSISAKTDGLMF